MHRNYSSILLPSTKPFTINISYPGINILTYFLLNIFRVVSVLRNWLYMSYDDFRSREMQQKLRGLCEFMERYLYMSNSASLNYFHCFCIKHLNETAAQSIHIVLICI